MTPRGTMKVRFTFTVELDPAQWADEYGCELSEVREDVRSHFTHQVNQLEANEILSLRITVA